MLNIETSQDSVHQVRELYSHDELQHFFNSVLWSVKNILEAVHLSR